MRWLRLDRGDPLPPQAVPLAASLVCPEQMFRLGRQAFGLQFHLEVTADSLERWIRQDRDFVCRAPGPGGPDHLRGEARRWLEVCRPVWCRWLDNLLTALQPPLKP